MSWNQLHGSERHYDLGQNGYEACEGHFFSSQCDLAPTHLDPHQSHVVARPRRQQVEPSCRVSWHRRFGLLAGLSRLSDRTAVGRRQNDTNWEQAWQREWTFLHSSNMTDSMRNRNVHGSRSAAGCGNGGLPDAETLLRIMRGAPGERLDFDERGLWYGCRQVPSSLAPSSAMCRSMCMCCVSQGCERRVAWSWQAFHTLVCMHARTPHTVQPETNPNDFGGFWN